MLLVILLFLFSSSGYLRLVPDSRIIFSLSQCLFSLSIYLRQNTLCFVIWSVFNCFFNLSFYLNRTHYILAYALYSIISSASASTPHRAHYVRCIICSVYNCFFGLNPYFAVNTFCLSYRNIFSHQSESLMYSVKSHAFYAEVTFSDSLTEVYF
jgi:hypothetical protein